jgi:hypothetical protein
MQQMLGWFSVFLAEACLAKGRLAEARERAEEGLAVTREVHFGYGAGLAQRTLGRIARAAGDLSAAAARLEEALATFAAFGVLFEEARTRLELARLARDRGRPGEAAREAAEARRRFVELEVPAWADRAAALCREVLPAPTG